ncbi:hypothetical protein HDU96_007082 [Phlyctochytrium bullatum]|nr:hypothetical protein HDU96_007082 [Phlyctochytrium bullatum]
MSSSSGTTNSAGFIDLAAQGIISEGTVTTIYSQIIQFIGQLLTAACVYILLQWHVSPRRQKKVTLAERRMVLVGLHGSLVELIDTIFFGLISHKSNIRGHAGILLLFMFVTYTWKVGELLVPSQVKFMVEKFTSTVAKPATPLSSFSGALGGAPFDPSGWSDLYTMNANGAVRGAMTTLQAAGVYTVVSANTTFTTPVTKSFTVSPAVLAASADISDILNRKDGKLALFVNNATQARLDAELATRADAGLVSLDVAVPAVLSAYACELASASYSSSIDRSVLFSNDWTAVNFSTYRDTQSLLQYNGLGGYGQVQYSLGDGALPTDSTDKLTMLPISAETTPLNMIKDIESASFLSASFKSAFVAAARNATARSSTQPIISHYLTYKCRGIVQLGRLSLTASRTAVNITRFESSRTLNQTDLDRNVLGGYHAFRPIHENLLTVQTACGNTGAQCGGASGLKSLGDLMGIVTAVEGAYIAALIAPAGSSRLANSTAAEFETVSETQDKKFVRVNVTLLVAYAVVAALPVLGASSLSLLALATATTRGALVLSRVWGHGSWDRATDHSDGGGAMANRRLGSMAREDVTRLAGTGVMGGGDGVGGEKTGDGAAMGSTSTFFNEPRFSEQAPPTPMMQPAGLVGAHPQAAWEGVQQVPLLAQQQAPQQVPLMAQQQAPQQGWAGVQQVPPQQQGWTGVQQAPQQQGWATAAGVQQAPQGQQAFAPQGQQGLAPPPRGASVMPPGFGMDGGPVSYQYESPRR